MKTAICSTHGERPAEYIEGALRCDECGNASSPTPLSDAEVEKVDDQRVHDLKCWEMYYDAIERGDKPFEYRWDDRGYRVGDILHLRRFDPDEQEYTGASLAVLVTYKLDQSNTTFPIAPGYCILGLGLSAVLLSEVRELRALLNTPEVNDFGKAVVLEALHQRQRWDSAHDAGKTPLDWFWLIGYLAQKAATSQMAGDTFKALHHTVSTAAALNNWHAAILGTTDMRPGLSEEAQSSIDATTSTPEDR